jgi:hypothetical protein
MSVLVVLLGVVHADPVPRETVAREQSVARLAAEVAAARRDGSGRAVVADLMARYRAQAEALAAVEEPLAAARADQERARRRDALGGLRDAVAKGTANEAARRVLAEWLGDGGDRLPLLRDALRAADGSNDAELKQAIALDVADQAGAVGLLALYDAEVADRAALRGRLAAAAERARSGPGSIGSLSSVIEAERREREAAAAQSLADASRTLARDASDLAAAALALSEEP